MARQRTAPPPPAAPAPDLTVTDKIDLDPLDFYLASWRNLPPLERPAVPPAPPFDLARCLKAAKAIPSNAGYWKLPILPGPLSPEEAHFWLVVYSRAAWQAKPETVLKGLDKEKFTGQFAPSAVAELVWQTTQAEGLQKIDPLIKALLTPEETIRCVLTRPPKASPGSRSLDGPFASGVPWWLAHEVVPYLSEKDRAALRPLVRQQLQSSTWPTYDHPDPSFHLAALLGMHEEVESVVKGLSSDAYSRDAWDDTCYHQPQFLVFGLGSAAQVEEEMRRLKLPLRSPEQIRGWLANTGTSGLDLIVRAIQDASNRDEAAKLFEALTLVRSPAAAGPMLELKLTSKVPQLARDWLERNLGNAIAGLMPVAAGRGKLAEAALDFLRTAKRKGHGELLATLAEQAEPDVAERIRQLVIEHVEKVYAPLDDKSTPDWLKSALAQAGAGKMPARLDTSLLPPVVVGADRCLNPEQVAVVLATLQKTALGTPSPLLAGLKEHADRPSLDLFAWKLFETWLENGAPAKEKWLMTALGHLGGEQSVLKVTPLIRAWPGESQHARAVHGLECLAAIGSDGALISLNGIAQKLKFKGLQNKAREMMDKLARELDLSRAELEDRIVPDLDLDERGRKTLDFGPRQFLVVLGPDLTPMVRDEDALKKDPPKPGKKDDAEKATLAVAEWKLLKKQLKEVARQQAYRLEQATITGRRWSPTDFERLLVRHPLMFLLVQRLLWAGYDRKGKQMVLFRVTEDRELVDARDNPVSLEKVAAVGLPHPLHLSEQEKATWGQVFGEYELISPFPQLGRPIYGLEKGEEKEKQLTRFASVRIPGLSVAGFLEGAGWERGYLHDHGDYHEHTKFFPSANLTAVLQYEPGLWAGSRREAEEQRLTGCSFFTGPWTHVWHVDLNKAVPLGEVDAVVLSEVLADLLALTRGR